MKNAMFANDPLLGGTGNDARDTSHGRPRTSSAWASRVDAAPPSSNATVRMAVNTAGTALVRHRRSHGATFQTELSAWREERR